jgi:hypothetical protein
MKTKIILLIGAVALVTLSFTFSNVEKPIKSSVHVSLTNASTPVGGIIADEVVK